MLSSIQHLSNFLCFMLLCARAESIVAEFLPVGVARLTQNIYYGSFLPAAGKNTFARHELTHTQWGMKTALENESFEMRLLDRNGRPFGPKELITQEMFDSYHKIACRKRFVQEVFEAQSTKVAGSRLATCCTINYSSKQKTCEFVGRMKYRYPKDQAFLTFELMKEAFKWQNDPTKNLLLHIKKAYRVSKGSLSKDWQLEYLFEPEPFHYELPALIP